LEVVQRSKFNGKETVIVFQLYFLQVRNVLPGIILVLIFNDPGRVPLKLFGQIYAGYPDLFSKNLQ
jgi:hypothetical protein